MSEDALKLAQQIAHEVWEKYDDTHGYRTEKQEANASVPTDNPDNIWFFWNQFDPRNQAEFVARVATHKAEETDAMIELINWCLTQPSL